MNGALNGHYIPPGRLIMQKRESVGLSMRELSALAGCSTSSVSNVEKGLRPVGIRLAKKLAVALDLTVEELMVREREEIPTPPVGTDPVEVEADVAAMARMVASARGVTVAEYLGAAMREVVRSDLAVECRKFLGPCE